MTGSVILGVIFLTASALITGASLISRHGRTLWHIPKDF